MAFLGGKEFRTFKGANEQLLFATIAELSEQVPDKNLASAHEKLQFKQFKPTHLKP
jgi:hypothetical protein